MFPFETMSAKMLDDYVGRKDALIIDLRGQEEYEKSHVKGAFNMPYERYMETGSLSMELSKGKILVFYCDRGGASIRYPWFRILLQENAGSIRERRSRAPGAAGRSALSWTT